MREHKMPPSKTLEYLLAVLLWSGGWFFLVWISDLSWLQWPVSVFSLLGGLGPLLLALWWIQRGHGRTGETVWAFLARSVNPSTLRAQWVFRIFLFAAFLAVAPLVISQGWPTGEWFQPGPLLFLVVGFVFGGLEEVGWRAYAQEHLQRVLPVLPSSLLIGFCWSLWHVPLFFLDGTYQAGLSWGSLEARLFLLGPIVASPFYAWLFNKTGRCAFAVVLYHGLSNVMREGVMDVQPWWPLLVEGVMSSAVIIMAWDTMKRRGE